MCRVSIPLLDPLALGDTVDGINPLHYLKDPKLLELWYLP